METSVLIVEDEVAIVTLLRYNLEREGFKVYSTGDGEEAVTMVEEYKPDVIVLDWMLPSLSGIEVCRRLKADIETAAIPILMLTAKGQAKDRETAEAGGVTKFMTKPFANQELLATVRALGD